MSMEYSDFELGLYYLINGVGGSGHTCTANWTTASQGNIAFCEFTGVLGGTIDSTPAGIVNNSEGGTGTYLGPSITSTVPNELVINCIATFNTNGPETITDNATNALGTWTLAISQGNPTTNFCNGAISYALPASSSTAVKDSYVITNDYVCTVGISIKPGTASTAGAVTISGNASNMGYGISPHVAKVRHKERTYFFPRRTPSGLVFA